MLCLVKSDLSVSSSEGTNRGFCSYGAKNETRPRLLVNEAERVTALSVSYRCRTFETVMHDHLCAALLLSL
jgi:hypothetical protein